jgi:hypothetical protein
MSSEAALIVAASTVGEPLPDHMPTAELPRLLEHLSRFPGTLTSRLARPLGLSPGGVSSLVHLGYARGLVRSGVWGGNWITAEGAAALRAQGT